MSLADLMNRHTDTLNAAVQANRSRQFYAHWPEAPSGKIYGENANADGQNAFQAMLNSTFEMPCQQGAQGLIGQEQSPYGFNLGIQYPHIPADTLLAQAAEAQKQWGRTSPEERAVVLIECLEQAARHFFEIAYATMHTTGQGFIMAFQASGPHAFDRALEAIASGYSASIMFAGQAEWTKPMGKMNVKLDKKYHLIPRGIDITIGCSTFPVWNSFPGIFASLITGNVSIAKAHPGSILPIAICIRSFQNTLAALGYNPHIIQLAADTAQEPVTMQLVQDSRVALVDYTGGPAFGTLLEKTLAGTGKQIYTEKAGVNNVLVQSVQDINAVLDNLAFSISLYSGQMCTAPQNIFIPQQGIQAGDTTLSFDQIAQLFVQRVDALVLNEKVGPGTLGAIQNSATEQRLHNAAQLGLPVLRAATAVQQAGFGHAHSWTPLILQADEHQNEIYEQEWFGPISFLIPISSAQAGVERMADMSRRLGALSCSIYSVDQEFCAMAEQAMVQAGTPVAFNFTGPIWINQSAAFSDFHGTGANPAANASFADLSFVSTRFSVIGSRSLIA